jgi:hypothetical protein
MFEIAFIIGIYSYLIFFLGVLGILYKNNVVAVTIVYLALVLFYVLKTKKIAKPAEINFDKTSLFLIFLIIVQALVNFIGVLGPELSFDSLWYHLTLPKIYLITHAIIHIPGGLLYYSDMPKLTEMLYVGGLSFGSEVFAKLIHFSFGILILFAIYKISRKFLSQKFSLIAVLIFYSSLVVGWESITAYVDLSRTFFEVLAFWGILNWFEKKNLKWLIASGIMMGFAITTKLVAVGSLIIFLALFAYQIYAKKEKILLMIKSFLIFVFFSFLIPLPWFIFSFLNTGNPFYPYFSSIPVDSGQSFALPNFLLIFKDFYNLFLNLSDPISPLYLILLPIIIFTFKKFDRKTIFLVIYALVALVTWYLTQELRGGRFIMPYLPVFSILAAVAVEKIKDKKIETMVIIVVVLVGLSSIFYRGLANKKFIPVLMGSQSKSEFLAKNLNFSFGDFYDTDGYFARNIKSSDKVLLYGFHNLYYVNFPFVDSSSVKKGDKFNYVAVQNSSLPARFSDWREIYYNRITYVKLYTKDGKQWDY